MKECNHKLFESEDKSLLYCHECKKYFEYIRIKRYGHYESEEISLKTVSVPLIYIFIILLFLELGFLKILAILGLGFFIIGIINIIILEKISYKKLVDVKK